MKIPAKALLHKSSRQHIPACLNKKATAEKAHLVDLKGNKTQGQSNVSERDHSPYVHIMDFPVDDISASGRKGSLDSLNMLHVIAFLPELNTNITFLNMLRFEQVEMEPGKSRKCLLSEPEGRIRETSGE